MEENRFYKQVFKAKRYKYVCLTLSTSKMYCKAFGFRGLYHRMQMFVFMKRCMHSKQFVVRKKDKHKYKVKS